MGVAHNGTSATPGGSAVIPGATTTKAAAPPPRSSTPGPQAGRTARLLALVSGLYITQYLGVGFLYVGLLAILRREGVSLEALAAVTLAGAAWAFKPLWAPLIDRFGRRSTGHYRRWLLILQPLLGLTSLALVAIPDPAHHLPLLSATVVAYTLTSATQDIAADGLTARAVDDATRPLANGVANAAQWLGNVLGGGLIVLIYAAVGWVPAMLVLTALCLLPLPLVLAHREALPAGPAPRLSQAYAALWQVFRRSGAARWGLLVMPLLLGGTTATYPLWTPVLTDAGWSLPRLGVVMGMLLAAPAAAASLLVGAALRRFGRARCLAVTGPLVALSTLALIPLVTAEAPVVTTTLLLGLHVAAMAAGSTLVYTVNMSLARPSSEGTDFTTLAAIAMVASYILGSGALYLAGSFGYGIVLAGTAVLALLGTVAGVLQLRTTPVGSSR